MNYSAQFLKIWFANEPVFPVFEDNYSYRQKKHRENMLTDLIFELKEWEKLKDQKPSGAIDSKLFHVLRDFFKNALNYSDDQLDVIYSKEMVGCTYHFVQAARLYDPGISFHDVFQACRNVWIMNGLQYLFKVPVKLTPSIFAYSMLYPYTDNYLDDPTIPSFEKYLFSLRFEERLKGKNIVPENDQEAKIFRMVEIIEEEWERESHPRLYESLLFIHHTQTKSTQLIKSDEDLTEEDTLKICIDKGGASVIADGYLILGNLSREQEEFLYNYGAYLQMLDDIQDASEDMSEGLYTWHGLQAKKGTFEFALNQTWITGQHILQMVDNLKNTNNEIFKMLMSKSIDLFLIESVIANSQFFSSSYRKKIESHSPFRFFVYQKEKWQLFAIARPVF